MASELPPFLSAECAMLLTNAAGYAAQVTLQKDLPVEKGEGLTGQLLVRGSKLFFAPEYQGSEAKLMRAAGLRYVWDAQDNRGYILSEAMQGYAPIHAHGKVTNVVVVTTKVGARSERIGGYHCEEEKISVQSTSGAEIFAVWRASELNGIPLRVSAESGLRKFSAQFSKIRKIEPSPKTFEPPDGFTKYESPESLTNELIARQQNQRRKIYDPGDVGEGFQGAHRQQGVQ